MMQRASSRSANPLVRLGKLGQSVWLDDISRSMIVSGELARLIREDGLAGITSNPTIFERAITGSPVYDPSLAELRLQEASAETAYDTLVVRDIQDAADIFQPLFAASAGDAGFVSLEVSPHLARDTQGTIREAQRLWAAVNRPNVFIKVPGTAEGIPAITALTAEGININVTLLFSVSRYIAVTNAYWAGLSTRLERGLSVRHIRSVASFFLSRIDALVDPRLPAELHGMTATACAQVAYRTYTTLVEFEQGRSLVAAGALPQRLLWASTGTKDPAYRDTKYVEALVGTDTIVTLPRKTLDAFRDHGKTDLTLERDVEAAEAHLKGLTRLGIDLEQAAADLENDGIRLFEEAFDKLHTSLRQRLDSVP